MNYIVLFVSVLAVLVASEERNSSMPGACWKAMHTGKQCCKKTLPMRKPTAELKECFQIKKMPPSCEMELCVIKKLGIATEEGTSIDKKKMIEKIEKDYEGYSDIIDNVTTKCINGDVSKYGAKDFCDPMKTKICMDLQILQSCDDWNDEANCKGTKDLVNQCVENFS